MPALSMFFGLIVYMYAKDNQKHHIPHIHVEYQDDVMNPRVVDVRPEKNYTLHIWFKNGEEGIFDIKPYLDYEMFKPLKELALFYSVRPAHGTIQWANEADLCPDTIYMDSVKI